MAQKKKKKKPTRSRVLGAARALAGFLFSVHYRRDRECGARVVRASDAAAAAAIVRDEDHTLADVRAHGPLPE